MTAPDTETSSHGAFLTDPRVPLTRLFDLKVRTIVIDPGHGGDDSGARGVKGIREKDITLDIARRLRENLRTHSNYQVLMTREGDVTVPLRKRIEYANVHSADLYISIHVNYVPRRPVNLIETYYFGQYVDDEALRLAEKENRDAEYKMRDYRGLVQKIGNSLKLHESRRLAASIQKSLLGNTRKHDTGIVDHGVKSAPFLVLLGVDVPSVLTEVACLSNRAEEEKLDTPEHREAIAQYIEEGIVNYLTTQHPKGETVHDAKVVR